MKGIEAVVGLAQQHRDTKGFKALPVALKASRQSGKNEGMAMLESRLLSVYAGSERALEIVKCAPAYKPQCLISKERFRRVTSTPVFQSLLKPQWSEGYCVSIGNASMKLVSADPKANNVGLTASLMLSADESQNILKEKFDVNFRPMVLSTGAPVVMSGTSWAIDSLLEEHCHRAAELEKELGFRLLYVIPWWRVAEEVPGYGEIVERDIKLYGEDHILIQTQYCCKPVESAGMLLNAADVASMVGDHPRAIAPVDGRVYVAGVDFASLREDDDDGKTDIGMKRKDRDSTVITIGELVYKVIDGRRFPIIRVVDQLWIQDVDPAAAVDNVYRYIFEHWKCVRAVLDKNGVGDAPTQQIMHRMPSLTTGLHLSAPIKSRLGYDLQGAIKTGRMRMWRFDDTNEWRESMFQMRQCRRFEIRENKVMRWGAPTTKIDGKDVHDDFVLSMAYCLEAGQEHLAAHVDPFSYSRRGVLEDWSFNAFE